RSLTAESEVAILFLVAPRQRVDVERIHQAGLKPTTDSGVHVTLSARELPVLHLNREAMNREIALDMRAGRRHAIVESTDHSGPMDSIGADSGVEMIVCVG